MRRTTILACSALLMGLSGCATDGYYGADVGWGSPYPYYGWYDGYYGPIYDGYWGSDGYFYYRVSDHDRHFHRGDHDHFSRTQSAPGPHYRQIQGNVSPQRGYKMPHYPHHERGR